MARTESKPKTVSRRWVASQKLNTLSKSWQVIDEDTGRVVADWLSEADAKLIADAPKLAERLATLAGTRP